MDEKKKIPAKQVGWCWTRNGAVDMVRSGETAGQKLTAIHRPEAGGYEIWEGIE